jgi:hypothetical protein
LRAHESRLETAAQLEKELSSGGLNCVSQRQPTGAGRGHDVASLPLDPDVRCHHSHTHGIWFSLSQLRHNLIE